MAAAELFNQLIRMKDLECLSRDRAHHSCRDYPDLANAFASASPGGLQHDGVPDAPAAGESIVQAVNAGLVVHICRDLAPAVLEADCHIGAAPGQRWNPCSLRKDGGSAWHKEAVEKVLNELLCWKGRIDMSLSHACWHTRMISGGN